MPALETAIVWLTEGIKDDDAMDLNVPGAGSDLTEDTHHLYTPSTLNQRQKDKALLNVKWLTGLCDFFLFSLKDTRQCAVKKGFGCLLQPENGRGEISYVTRLAASFLPYRSFVVACVLAAKKISHKVTIVSHSPTVSAIESDWPAFKGKDYQQAGSKE